MNYNKLWKLLIDRPMTKMEMYLAVGLSEWDKAGVDLQIRQHHDDVRKKLKQKIMDLSAEQFEELVLALLFRKIGFTAVSRTRLSETAE